MGVGLQTDMYGAEYDGKYLVSKLTFERQETVHNIPCENVRRFDCAHHLINQRLRLISMIPFGQSMQKVPRKKQIFLISYAHSGDDL